MPVVVQCPTCAGPLRVAGDLIGRRVRCPSCSTLFDAPAATPDVPIVIVPVEPWRALDLSLDSPPAVPEAPLAHMPVGAVEIGSEALPTPRPQSPEPDELRACPSCYRLVSIAAKQCPTCGARLRERLRAIPEEELDGAGKPVRRDVEPHRGTAILVVGLMSVLLLFFGCPLIVPWALGLVLGIIAWIMGSYDVVRIQNGEIDPEGRDHTHTGWICGIIGTVMNSILLLAGLTVFAILMAQPTPTQTKPKWVPPGAAQKNQ